MMTSKQRTVIGLAALLALAATQACGSSDTSPSPSPTPTAGAGGASHAGAAGALNVSGGGSTAAGAGGAPAAGSSGAPTSGGSGGTPATGGSGGAAAGAGGAAGGAGGAAAGAGGGGTSPEFAAVKALFATSCATGTCHNKASKNLDYQGTTDLWSLLTTPIAAGIDHCVGSTLAVSKDAAGSYLLAVVKGATQCQKGGGNIGRMPDNCKTNGNPMCLSDAQVKIISDWIAAGVPK